MANLTRQQREQRAYTMTLVGGGASVAAVVFLVLAIVGITSLGPAILAGLIAAGAIFGFRRTVRS